MSDATLRTFVALLLPDGVRTGLAAVSEELRAQTRGLAWVPPENLHLTLRFLGEVGPATLEHVRDAVAAAAAAVAPFTVSLGGLGGFPAGRAPRVLWASVATGGEKVEALFAELEAALVARGHPGGEPGLPSPRHARPGAGSAGGEGARCACWAPGRPSARCAWRRSTSCAPSSVRAARATAP